jgi:hypothetical protein
MAHNVCCDSYRVHDMTYLLYYCNYVRVKYVTCAISRGHCSLFGLLVVMSIVVVSVLLLFSWMGWEWGDVPVHLFFVVCYCFLFWVGCVLSNSAIMKSDLLFSVVTV